MKNKPSLAEALKTNQAKALPPVETLAPKGWERGSERLGNTGKGSTGPLPVDTTIDEAGMLERAGFNPEEWEIVPPVNYREWDANLGNGEVRTFQYRKFDVRKKTEHNTDVQELVAALDDWRYTPFPFTTHSNDVFCVAIGDTQWGKVDGDGTAGTLDRTLHVLDRALDEYLSVHHQAKHVHLAFLGDCIEGFVSQGGKNAWRTELTLTEQIRLTRRVMMHAVKLFAKYAETMTVVSIPGNHDEAIREPVMTTYDDSYAVDALVAVQEAMDLAPQDFSHVTTVIPRRDELVVTVDVGGTIVTHAHGHQWRPGKHWEWWQGQSFEHGADPGKAHLLLSAHGHHLQVDTKGSRTWVMIPALESKSQWWLNKTGDHGAPGLLTMLLSEGRVRSWTLHRHDVEQKEVA